MIWINEDLIPSKEILALGARRRFRAGKIGRNWTYQGEVFICLKEDPTPIHIKAEKDFPLSTALKEGEGMLPREVPLRGRQLNNNYYNNYQRQNMGIPNPVQVGLQQNARQQTLPRTNNEALGRPAYSTQLW